MRTLLDAGCLISIDRGDRALANEVKRRRLAGERLATHGGVVAQVWRSSRQVKLGQTLRAATVVPLDGGLGRLSGLLLAVSGTADVIDAALVAMSADGDEILTSDPDDIAYLAEHSRRRLRITPV